VYGVLPSCGVICSVLCVSLVDVVVIYDIEYGAFKVKEHFIHLFVLVVCAVDVIFFYAVHVSAFFGYLNDFQCGLYLSVCMSFV
jgi:hypothetical protein